MEERRSSSTSTSKRPYHSKYSHQELSLIHKIAWQKKKNAAAAAAIAENGYGRK
jgi:hypothetical protein